MTQVYALFATMAVHSVANHHLPTTLVPFALAAVLY